MPGTQRCSRCLPALKSRQGAIHVTFHPAPAGGHSYPIGCEPPSVRVPRQSYRPRRAVGARRRNPLKACIRLRGLGGVVGLVFCAPQIDSDFLSSREPTSGTDQHQPAPAAGIGPKEDMPSVHPCRRITLNLGIRYDAGIEMGSMTSTQSNQILRSDRSL